MWPRQPLHVLYVQHVVCGQSRLLGVSVLHGIRVEGQPQRVEPGEPPRQAVPTGGLLVHQPRQFPSRPFRLPAFLAQVRGAIIDSMAQLIVRNLDEEIVTRLRQRAAKHRRSTEAEHREILREVLLPARRRSSLKEHLLAMPDVGADHDFERPLDRPRKRLRL